MRHSPLQLLRYSAPEISVAANPVYDAAKPIEVGVDQLAVESKIAQQKVPDNFPGHSWSVEMTITQTIKEGQNFPYTFRLSLVGLFLCRNGQLPIPDEERFVRINGSSMLYGAAREVVRSVTTLGPWGDILLPTASFYDKEPPKGETSAAPKSDESERA